MLCPGFGVSYGLVVVMGYDKRRLNGVMAIE
jgi:hypothetical protein